YPEQVADAILALRQPPWIWIDALPSDYDRAAVLIKTYASTKIDLVDCVVTAIAERMNITRILTVDRRDFSILRPKHCPAFELLP
ncbi:MAG TPA: hypothetical protein VJZ27_08405, partial [Aggregatilineales bacterium]|nr:hypothetical protein [Aggregatilineales bacterium]